MRLFLASLLIGNLFLNAACQTSMTFSHLGNATYQNNFINPSLIPEGNVFIGLPVLSGTHLHLNNKVSYNESFTQEGSEVTVDIDKILRNLQNQNMASSHVNLNLFHVGFKTEKGALVSISGRERMEIDLLYSKQLIDFLWNGNSNYLDQDVKISKLGAKASHFREFGLGYAAPINERLSLGIRGKFLVGFLDASTPHNLSATLNTDGETYEIDAEWSNASLRTSGFDIYAGDEGNLGSHLIMNRNTGMALDVGATYRLNKHHTVSGSLLDAGFISWKEDIENEVLNDTTFSYSGVILNEIDDVIEVLEDSLLSNFETTTNTEAYRGWLPLRVNGNWIYHYNEKMDLYASVGARLIQRQLKMLYGLGINRRMGRSFTASLSATKLPQQFANIGAALAVNGGPVQFYIAVDQVINFSIPDSKALDFRFGMNFVFHREGKELGNVLNGSGQGSGKGTQTSTFLGKEVKVKRKEGIYSIIKRQKPRNLNKRNSK